MKKKSLGNGQTDKELLELANILNIDINSIDFLENLLKNDLEEGNYITNLDDVEGGGTHWVGFKLYKNYCFYYDSFGFRPELGLIKFCKDNNLKCIFNIDQFQDLKESLCGLYVMLFFLLDSHLFIKDKSTYNQVLEEMKYWKIEP